MGPDRRRHVADPPPIASFTPTTVGDQTVSVKVTNAVGVTTVTQRTISVVAGPSSGLVAGSVTLTPDAPTTNAALTAAPEGFSGGTGPLTFSYPWFNGTRQLATTGPTLDLSVAGNGDRGDTVSVCVSASDGQNSGGRHKRGAGREFVAHPHVSRAAVDGTTATRCRRQHDRPRRRRRPAAPEGLGDARRSPSRTPATGRAR